MPANLDKWRGYAQAAEQDSKYVERMEVLSKQRGPAMAEMRDVLTRYVDGEISVEELRSIFQTKSMRAWSCFGLKGVGGAMVVNQLVKRIPAADLDPELKAALQAPPPDDEHAALEQLSRFYKFAEGWRVSHGLTKMNIQTTMTPFLVSGWWHVQNPDAWPIFYVSARNALQRNGLYTPTGNPVEDYFTFRARFHELQKALGTDPWRLEQICARLDSGGNTAQPGPDPEPTPDPEPAVATGTGPQPSTEGHGPSPTKQEEGTHTHVQWMLARIGQRLGLKVWIAENDRNRQYKGQKLGEMSIKALPSLGLGSESQQTIRLIDVVWVRGVNQIVAAFEVEHTTSIFSGLLRMADLVALYPNLSFPLYIVAPQSRMEQVRRQLLRPTFQQLDLRERCWFFSDEALAAEFEHIVKWASDPLIIQQGLAQRVDAAEAASADPSLWLSPGTGDTE
ncbi:MAG: hypothetical protein M3441_01035 [Chloroflexota bacterium]|nr:hypothetical protein [Chloroflexota bacterium]